MKANWVMAEMLRHIPDVVVRVRDGKGIEHEYPVGGVIPESKRAGQNKVLILASWPEGRVVAGGNGRSAGRR